MPQLTRVLVLSVLFTPLAGCGSGTPTPVNQIELKNIYDIYWHFNKRNEKPPTELADLDRTEYDSLHPTALRGLREGKYEVVWGLKSKDGRTVLAYEKDVPTKGGRVIMADGTIKAMTAAEFNR